MIIIGITGGVGSGKSRVLADLRDNYGAYTVEADSLAHALMKPCGEIYNKIAEYFGRDILMEAEPHEIDRKKLGLIVFNDRDKLDVLDGITHPAVKKEILRLIDEKKKEGNVRLFVIEAALLIEDGYKEVCDEIWYVWAPYEERIKRLMESRDYTRERCVSMFDSQKDDGYYFKYADFTINNQSDYKNSSKQLNARLNKLFGSGIIL